MEEQDDIFLFLVKHSVDVIMDIIVSTMHIVLDIMDDTDRSNLSYSSQNRIL